MKEKILIYLCMNAIFSKTMQGTETQISQFIVEGTLSIQYLVHVLLTIERLVFKLKKFSAALRSCMNAQFFVKSQPYKVNP